LYGVQKFCNETQVMKFFGHRQSLIRVGCKKKGLARMPTLS